jgi:hypothetical protein
MARLFFGVIAALLCSCAPRATQQGYGAAPARPYATGTDPTVVCQHACYRYFECKGGSSEPAVGAQCVQDCLGSGVDPSSVQALATADCLTIISAFDGGAPIPGTAPTASAAAPAAAAQPAAVAAAAPAPVAAAPLATAALPPPPAHAATAPTAVPAAALAAAAPPVSNACPPPGSDQLAQLLVSSLAWCHSPNGAAPQERVVFAVDGRFTQGGGNAAQGCWRAGGDSLQLTVAGQAYAPIQLQVTRAANGYPNLNANGKEYHVCN